MQEMPEAKLELVLDTQLHKDCKALENKFKAAFEFKHIDNNTQQYEPLPFSYLSQHYGAILRKTNDIPPLRISKAKKP